MPSGRAMQEEVISYIVLLALALVCLFKQQLLSKRGREEITMAHLFSNRFAVPFSRGILVSLTNKFSTLDHHQDVLPREWNFVQDIWYFLTPREAGSVTYLCLSLSKLKKSSIGDDLPI